MRVTAVLDLELWTFVGALAAIVAYRLLTRTMRLNGLLSRKDGSRSTSPERIQLFVFTLVMSIKYLTAVAHSTDATVPAVSSEWLYIFGGSSGIYVVGKALSTFKHKVNDTEEAG